MIFILDTTSLDATDKQRVLEKEKQLALSLLDKPAYKNDDSNIKIGASNIQSRSIDINISREKLRVLIQSLRVGKNIDNNLKGALNEAIYILAKSPSDKKKSIVLFTVGSKYNAYSDRLKEMKEEDIKLVVVDVNKALSPPVANPPFAAAPRDLPEIVKPEPETSEIATAPFVGM